MQDSAGGEVVVLTASRSDGLRVTREYRFQNGSYVIGHRAVVEGLPAAHGTPTALGVSRVCCSLRIVTNPAGAGT